MPTTGEREIVVRTDPEAQADLHLFANDVGFNELRIVLTQPMPRLGGEGDLALPPPGDQWTLVAITEYGLVLATDSVRESPRLSASFGFHNVLIPWGNIQAVYQHIET